MGFPDPWLLRYTDVTIPSQHTIDKKRYSAEIILSHTYSNINKTDKLIGNVAILVDVGTEADFYGFFELYLQRWEAAAAQVAVNCNQRRGLGRNVVKPDRDLAAVPVDSYQWLNLTYYKGRYHPYMFYHDTGTEYYFRYEGSVIEPPCLEYVHWRVLRLPVKISLSQFERLNALFQNRLNPSTCQKQTAGRSVNGTIDVHRPLQTATSAHELVYCECANWHSPEPNDVAYCNLTMEQRGVFNYTPV
jgi:hypothetical protein